MTALKKLLSKHGFKSYSDNQCSESRIELVPPKNHRKIQVIISVRSFSEDMNLSDFAQNLVTPAIAIAGAAWLSKEIVSTALSRQSAIEVEKIRQEMRHALELNKHNFSIQLSEHKEKFSKSQEKRVEPILNLYSSFSELFVTISIVKTILSIYPDDDDIEEELEEFYNLVKITEEKYLKSLLFLPSPISQKVDVMIEKIISAEMSYDIEMYGGSGEKPKARKILLEKLKGCDDPNFIKSLANDFRLLLGVELLEK